MSRPEMKSAGERHAARGAAGSSCAGRGVGSAAAVVLGMLACLPSEDLSSYSSSYRRAEPAIALEGSVSDGEAQPAPSAAAPELPVQTREAPPGAAPLAESCNGDCSAPDLPLLLDAGSSPELTPGESGGSVAPSDVTASEGDAGVEPAPLDAAPPTPCGEGTCPCGQGALLAPDDRCFALVTTPSTWSDARDACEARGAGWDLAVIRGDERNTWLAEMLAGVTDAWVGANDLAQEGSWRWVGDPNPFFTGTGAAGSATAGAFVSWNTGGAPEPNGGAASDCLRLRANGGWADIACSSTFAALCEGPLP